jgi:hypothetical protein
VGAPWWLSAEVCGASHSAWRTHPNSHAPSGRVRKPERTGRGGQGGIWGWEGGWGVGGGRGHAKGQPRTP